MVLGQSRTHLFEDVADENDRDARAEQAVHVPNALVAEASVADGKHLVDEQDVRFHVGGDGETQAGLHAAGIALHRRVDELAYAGELDDLVFLGLDFPAFHPQDGAVEVKILPAGQVSVEPGSDLDQGRKPPIHHRSAAVGAQNARKDLEQGALAGAVGTDDPQRRSMLDAEGQVAQGPRSPFPACRAGGPGRASACIGRE